jgi:hypothetical protein
MPVGLSTCRVETHLTIPRPGSSTSVGYVRRGAASAAATVVAFQSGLALHAVCFCRSSVHAGASWPPTRACFASKPLSRLTAGRYDDGHALRYRKCQHATGSSARAHIRSNPALTWKPTSHAGTTSACKCRMVNIDSPQFPHSSYGSAR